MPVLNSHEECSAFRSQSSWKEEDAGFFTTIFIQMQLPKLLSFIYCFVMESCCASRIKTSFYHQAVP